MKKLLLLGLLSATTLCSAPLSTFESTFALDNISSITDDLKELDIDSKSIPDLTHIVSFQEKITDDDIELYLYVNLASESNINLEDYKSYVWLDYGNFKNFGRRKRKSNHGSWYHLFKSYC